MMDAISATIFDGVWAIVENRVVIELNLLSGYFIVIVILNQAKAFLPNPFRMGCPCPIGRMHS